VGPGEVIALLGRNGAGKSTTLKTMAGWLSCRRGMLKIDGIAVAEPSPETVNRAGVALVPEDRQVFPTLTVEENLRLPGVAHAPGRWTFDDVWRIFPLLQERRKAKGSALSGGEQQMLSIGRALLCQPSTLLLDEPTEGLAPVVVASLTEAIRAIAQTGMAIVLVEQNAKVPKQIASRFYVFDSGRIAWRGSRTDLDTNQDHVTRLLSL
jgi:branched-chain amino acid transport system ATP-binding protein